MWEKLKRRIYRIIFRPTDPKAFWLSMGTAFLVWLFVRLDSAYTTSAYVNLVWNLPDSIALQVRPPDRLQFQYSGTGWQLVTGRGLKRPLTITLPSDVKAGQAYELTSLDLRNVLRDKMPAGVQIIDVSPKKITLLLDRREVRRVPVRPVLEVDIADGLVLRRPVEVIPDSVQVSGPAGILDTLDHIPARLQGISLAKPGTIKANARLADPSGVLNFVPRSVSIGIQTEQLTEKSFLVPIEPIHTRDSVRIFPKRVKVIISVPLSRYDSVTARDFRLVVDFDELGKGRKTNSLPIRVARQPDRIKDLKLTHPAVEFLIEKQ